MKKLIILLLSLSLYSTTAINIENCETKVYNEKTCKKCSPTYALSPDKTQCTQCDPGFTGNQFTCVPEIKGCLFYKQDQCMQCKNEKQYPNQKLKKCTDCPDNLYALGNDKRICNIPGCKHHDPHQIGQCLRCTKGKDKDYDQALNEDKTQCIQCPWGQISQKGVVCHEKIQNCREYDDEGNCIQCYLTYYITDNNQCIQCPSPGKQNPKDFTKCIVDNCQSLQEGKIGICKKCQKGFGLESNSCVDCSYNNQISEDGLICHDKVQNCINYNEKTGICEQCEYDFFLDEESNSCSECLFNTFSDDGIQCEVENCEVYDEYQPFLCKICSKNFEVNEEKNLCEPCNEGYIAPHGITCHSEITGCQDYLADGECTACEENHFLKEEQGGQCTPCPSGSKSDNGLICTVDNCKSYQKDNNNRICRACRENYRLDASENRCARCQGAEMSQNGIRCHPVVPDCKDYDDLGNCLLCFDDLYLDQEENLCEAPIGSPHSFLYVQKKSKINRK